MLIFLQGLQRLNPVSRNISFCMEHLISAPFELKSQPTAKAVQALVLLKRDSGQWTSIVIVTISENGLIEMHIDICYAALSLSISLSVFHALLLLWCHSSYLVVSGVILQDTDSRAVVASYPVNIILRTECEFGTFKFLCSFVFSWKKFQFIFSLYSFHATFPLLCVIFLPHMS